MSFGLRARLSLMMFFQYAVWGIWLPNLAQRLDTNDLNLAPAAIGWIFSVYGIGAILGPFVMGQLADRYFSTERVMAVAHFVGGLLLIATAYVTSAAGIFALLFLYCNLYMPTMGLSNSITFRNLGEGHQDRFPGIRLWGTIGWIAAGWGFAAYLDYEKLDFYRTMFHLVGLDGAFTNLLAWWHANVVPTLRQIYDLPAVGAPGYRDCLRISGLLSLIYAAYCLTLPHTPPVTVSSDTSSVKKSAVMESLALMKFPSFAVLVVIAGLIGIMLAFYFACENLFLVSVGVDPKNAGAFMTIGQIAEFGCMTLVPLAVNRLGVKRTMLLGAAAWAVRFGLSAYGRPQWLMIATIALHGFAFGFFFVVAQMYVDRAASPDIKATAQSLLVFVVYGLGTVLGSVVSGYVRTWAGGDWSKIWMGPFILTLVCMAIFALFFRDKEIGQKVEVAEPAMA